MRPCLQAQACPSAVCNSYFANAVGGPTDCCKFSYSGNGAKCQWGGTPVSFTLTGTCSADGKTYQTLAASNMQGPPGQANCRCKDPTAGSTPTPAPVPVTGFVLRTNTDVPGKDLPSDGKSFTQVCGPPSAVAARCAQGHRAGPCVGFVYDEKAKCGFIKSSAAGATARAGFTLYTVAPPTAVPGYVGRAGYDIQGKDLPSDGQSFTKVCGPPSAVADRCNRGHRAGPCVGFTYDAATKCGFIKSSADTAVVRSGFAVYVKASITPKGALALPGAGH